MVAENPPSNGDDRGSSLPPEPPNNSGQAPMHKLTFSELCEKNTQSILQTTKDAQKKLNTMTNEIRYLLARNSSAMAIIGPSSSPKSSNNICTNPTHAGTFILPVGTSPQIFSDPYTFMISENRENTKTSKF